MAARSVQSRRRIVVVEDDESTAIIIQYNCEAAGYEVAHIVDGREAAEVILDDPPDLVVLDWRLPGMSGIELLRRLRTRAETRNVPVVMVTARAESDDHNYAIAAGADTVLPKTITVGALMACISGLLSPDRDRPRGGMLDNGAAA